jgi:hypothetical protein
VVPVGVRAGGVATAVLLLGGLGWSQSGDLVVTPGSGGPGTTVTVSQGGLPEGCGTYTVLFDGLFGGEDDASDGEGSVTFDVPEQAEPGIHSIKATCSDHDTVGRGAFEVRSVPVTTTTTIDVPTTGVPAETTTTRDGAIPTTTSTTEGDGPVPTNPDECEAEARTADTNVRFSPDRSMIVGQRNTVTAAVSLDEVPPPDVTFEDTTTVVTLVGAHCIISAKLTGSDFDITQQSNEEQSFVGSRVLVWRWEVRPRSGGDDLGLTLTVQATLVDGDQRFAGPNKLYEAQIDVDAVQKSAWTKLWDDISGFLHDPIVASVLAAVLVAALLKLGPKTYRNVRARYARPSVPRPPPE